jgi:hypothetical protein
MIYLEPNQIPAHLRAGYTGKKFKAELVDTVTIYAEAGTWSGGSRDLYFALDLTTGEKKSVTDTFSAPWDNNRKEQKITLKSGFAVVRRQTFQGVDLGLTFYLLPSDAAPLLPPPSEELTETELTVLAIIRGLKSSYRADEYRRKGISEAEAEAIKAGLIRREYLNKAGAITTKGKNAAGDRRPY